MSLVSILLPAFFFEDDLDIVQQISQQLGLHQDQFSIIPFEDQCQLESPFGNLKEYGIKMFNSDLSLRRIECILEEQNITQKKVEKCKEALTTLSQEFNNLVSNPNVLENLDNQKLAKRTKKLKQVKEDNRKLRQLLKAQLENSEKMRVDTQTTVETLREEFDLLVNELSNLQKKDFEANQQPQQQQQQQLYPQTPPQHQQNSNSTSLQKKQQPPTFNGNFNLKLGSNQQSDLNQGLKQNNYMQQQQQQQQNGQQQAAPPPTYSGIPLYQQNQNLSLASGNQQQLLQQQQQFQQNQYSQQKGFQQQPNLQIPTQQIQNQMKPSLQLQNNQNLQKGLSQPQQSGQNIIPSLPFAPKMQDANMNKYS